jgi:hypothetical protein
MSGLVDFEKAEMNNKKQYSRHELHLKTTGVEDGPARVSLSDYNSKYHGLGQHSADVSFQFPQYAMTVSDYRTVLLLIQFL